MTAMVSPRPAWNNPHQAQSMLQTTATYIGFWQTTSASDSNNCLSAAWDVLACSCAVGLAWKASTMSRCARPVLRHTLFGSPSTGVVLLFAARLFAARACKPFHPWDAVASLR
ncbi:unnamed protein product [Polarella glacialis]|uniref:Uncharacterized protein n=1 Tax=Polarella glacialis TaxID=89957 RepID=A0A813HD22_POLGL|nr:unnamed protein product [Polarella glacialis]